MSRPRAMGQAVDWWKLKFAPPFKGAMSVHGLLHTTFPLAISGPVSGASSPLPSNEVAYTD